MSRIAGVGDIQVFGASSYGMRVWLDTEKLKSRNLTTEDVLDAIREQWPFTGVVSLPQGMSNWPP